MKQLTDVLANYGIKGEVVRTNEGPLVRQIEFLPEAGTKIKNVEAVLEDVARELGVNSLRVEAVENSPNLGFEIPEEEFKTIDFIKLADSEVFKNFKAVLPLCLGVDIAGNPVLADLAKMPHLLVAGTTGSGKSVGLNTFILSLIMRKKPTDLKLVLIDPKRIEFGRYNHQQYMLGPVVTDMTEASLVLAYLAEEMERRYLKLEASMSRNIEEYHFKVGIMPYIVCMIDEFADLITINPQVEKYIRLLAQKARACGIHIILATQRPSVDVVTGVLKANFPTRLAYKVASSADSRTILDASGAEKLLGRGDALFLPQTGELKRIHGAYIEDAAIEKVLSPYRADVKEWNFSQIFSTATKKGNISTTNQPGIFRRILGWWSSLKVRERKTLVSGVISVVKMFFPGTSGKK